MLWPETGEALAWLAGQGLQGDEARVLLRAAGGRPDDALRFAQSGRDPQSWSKLPRAMARGDSAALASLTPAQAIDALQKLCHDLLARAAGARPRFFEAADLPDTPQDIPVAALTAWSRNLTQAARTAEHPFNPGLMLEALACQARQALRAS
jgi:DNA polymerase-3 subunit delta'